MVTINPVNIVKRVSIEKSPWIKLERIFYREQLPSENNSSEVCDHFKSFTCDEFGSPLNLGNNIRYWDVCTRNNSDHTVVVNSASTLALCYTMANGSYSFYVSVVEQFRPSVNAKTLEFPSGICDEGETVKECSLRELKEETGYTGVVVTHSPYLPTTVLGNDNTCLVTVLVNLDDEHNQNPVQNLEPTETITSHIFPLCNLLKNLEDHCSKTGSRIADNLYLFSYALSLVPYEAVHCQIVNMVEAF